MNIKPIETEYRGIKFRSKLEAQWAVFFDLCGVEWEYEPEGFDLGDGVWYLPDFLLKNVKVCGSLQKEIYCEIKGVMDADSIKKLNYWMLGDYHDRTKSMIKNIDFALMHGWQMDYPLGQAELIRSIIVLGKFPFDHSDFLNINDWIENNYPASDYFKSLFYSAKTCYPGNRLWQEGHYVRIFPMIDSDNTFCFTSASYLYEKECRACGGDFSSIVQNTEKAFYNARNYRFDHRKR